MSVPSTDKVCVVVVAWRPKPEIAANLAAMLAETPHLVVVENAAEIAAPPGAYGRPDLSGLADLQALSRELGFHLIANRANLGQAAALNQGLDWARAQGFEFACLFDQDSRPRPGYLAAMLDLWPRLPDRPAVLGCNYDALIQGQVKAGFPQPPAEPFFEHVTAITAGSFLPFAALAEVGPFRENFFIDHVDHDWCLRARALGFHVHIASARLIVHSIGAISYHRFLGKRLETSNHSALRRYYWHRNGLRLALEHWRREWRWGLMILCFFMPTGLANMLLFERRRGQKLAAVLHGLLDGLLGRMGR